MDKSSRTIVTAASLLLCLQIVACNSNNVVSACASDAEDRRPVLIWPTTSEGLAGAPAEMEEGRLLVPERRVDGARCIEIAFLRLRSRATEPAAPIFFVGGGPGEAIVGPALRGDGYYSYAAMLTSVADVILIDQPSIGLSRPRLPHPQSTRLAMDRPYSTDDALRAATEDARTSVAYWTKRGIDLNGYNVEEWVDHLDDLRRSLHYEKIALHGHSFGSHTALTMLRRHPPVVDRAFLLLPEGLDQTVKLPADIDATLSRLSDLVRSDSVWGSHMPDLAARIGETVKALDAEPVTVRFQLDGASYTIVLGGEDVKLFVGKAMGDTYLMRRLPVLVTRWQRGDFSELAKFSYERRSGQLSRAGLWYHLADAASGVSEQRRREIEFQRRRAFVGAYTDHVTYRIPEHIWSVRDLGNSFREPVQTNIPVQFYVTELDARTPPSNVTSIAKMMGDYGVMTVTNIGHDYPDEGSPASLEWERDVIAFFSGSDPETKTYDHPLNLAAPEDVEQTER